MKRYRSLGELLIDYRAWNNISQLDFANNLNVDVRSIQRWEKDQTLVKPEKEDEIVDETLLPYQLIRNLNASVVIPTFYDFSINKYSLTELTNELPGARWFNVQLKTSTKNIRNIDFKLDLKYFKRIFKFHKLLNKNLESMIDKSINLLPDLNKIITDDSGYYSGHSIIFPIHISTFEKLKNKEITVEELTEKDLVNYKTIENPIFFIFDLTADCNNNAYYLVNNALNFFDNLSSANYILCSCAFRNDTITLNHQFGLNMAWEENIGSDKNGLPIFKRFYEGNLNSYFLKLKSS